MSKKPKADKRANPKYDEPQSIYREGINAEEALRELLADKSAGNVTRSP